MAHSTESSERAREMGRTTSDGDREIRQKARGEGNGIRKLKQQQQKQQKQQQKRHAYIRYGEDD
jgi:hypothetical protein